MKSRKETPAPRYAVTVHDNTFAVLRNERHLMTPGGTPYLLPTQGLAEAIASEWQAQIDKINPLTMPMTQFAATALDVVAKDREKTISSLLGYIDSEQLCLRAAEPPALVARQREVWQPYLDWCLSRFDIALKTGTGILPVHQPQEVCARFRKVIDTYDTFTLTGLTCAAEAAGSLVLGLALLEGFRGADDLFHAAELDSTFQKEAWGDDPVLTAKHDAVRQEIDACAHFISLCKVK